MRSPWNSMRTKIINPIVAKIRACLANKKWSLNFLHSSLITHFFTLIWQHHFYFHHLIFSHYLWVLHLSAGTFFFSSTQTHWIQWKKKKKNKKNKTKRKETNNRTANPWKEKKKEWKPTPAPKKKKKGTANANPEKKKKKVKRWSKVVAMGPLYVFNYNIVIKLWVMETENSQKLFSVFITHNSKIR